MDDATSYYITTDQSSTSYGASVHYRREADSRDIYWIHRESNHYKRWGDV